MSLDESNILYTGTQTHEDDKRLLARFTVEPRLDRKATSEAADGVNRYKNVEFITIHIPGDKTLSVHRPVQPSDRQRFPLQYAAFKNSVTGEQLIGLPLTAWPMCKPSQVKELEYFNVRTVEQLAAMPDGVAAAQMMGIQALRNAARSFVEQRKQEAPLIKVNQELKERDDKIAALQSTVEEQSRRFEALMARLGDDEEKPKKGK